MEKRSMIYTLKRHKGKIVLPIVIQLLTYMTVRVAIRSNCHKYMCAFYLAFYTEKRSVKISQSIIEISFDTKILIIIVYR